MQYNKDGFSKINDKKILHKVKKQWVTISLSMLAILGAAGVDIYDTTSAHADNSDDVSQDENVDDISSSDSTNVEKAHDNIKQLSPNSNIKEKVNNDNAENNLQKSKTDLHISDQQIHVSNKYQTKSISNDNKQSVYQDNNVNKDRSLNNKAVGSNQANDNEQKGFDSGLNNNNNNTNKNLDYQNGYNLYNKYKQAISDGVNNKSNSQYADKNSNQYYDAAKSGYGDAQNKYNNDTNNQGTNSNVYNHYDGNTNDASKAKQDGENYSNNNADQFDTVKNSSVNLNNNQINIDTNDPDFNKKQSAYTDPLIGDVYRYGVNYFFANQATKDAKLGKWQGTNYDHGTYNSTSQTTSTKDFYDSNINNKNGQYDNDAYYQSYEGAKKAIADQYDNNGNYVGLKNNISNNNHYYNSSYNSVVQDSQKGIAYVNDAKQFNQIITGYTNSTSVTNSAINTLANTSKKLVNDIRLVNDINLADVSTSSTGESGTNPTLNTNLTLDGQNHLADLRWISYYFNTGSSGQSVTVKNFKTLYGQNYWGPIASSKGVINFDDVNYVGPQMLQSTNNDVYISGNVNDFQDFPINIGAKSFSQYVSPFSGIPESTDGYNQQGLYVNNLTLAPNSNFFSATSSGEGAPNIELTGNLTLGNQAHMTLLARNSGGDGNNNNDSIGLSSGAKLSIANDSQLNIIPDVVSGQTNYANAISASGATVDINGGQFNVLDNGSSYDDSEVLYFSGSNLNITNNGLLNLKVRNMNSSSDGNDGLLDASGSTINVANGQMIIDASDPSNTGANSGSFYLINGNVNVINPGKDGVVLKKNKNIKYLYSGSVLNSQTSSVNNNLYYQYQLNSDNTVNYIEANGKTNNAEPINNNQQNTIDIEQTPGVYVVGSVSGNYDSANHTATMTGLLKVTEYKVLKSDRGIYFHGYTNGIKNDISNPVYQSGYDDQSKYDYRLDPENADANGFIRFTEIIKNVDSKPNDIDADIKYGIQGININLAGNNYNNQTVSAQSFAKNGNNMVPSTPLNLSVNNNSEITNAINTALHDIDNPNNPDKDLEAYNKNTDGYTNNYDSTIAGYRAYNPKQPNINFDSTLGYQQAYDNGTGDAFKAGYQEAQKNTLVTDEKNGANDYVNGISEDTTAHPSGSYYDDGYKSAKTGYLDGLTNNSVNNDHRTSAKSTTGYDIGNNAGIKEHSNYVNAENDPNTASTQSTAKGVADAIQAVNDAMNNHDGNADDVNNLSENSDNNLKYQAAYNAALSSAKVSNNNGIDAVLNGDKPDTTNMTTANADIYNHAYKDAQKGVQEGLAGNNVSIVQMTPDERAAFDQANQYQNGFQTAFKDYPNVQPNNESIKGYNATIKGIQAADNHSDQSGGLSGIDLTIYNAAKSQKQGQIAAISVAQNSNQNNNGAEINGIDTSNGDAKSSYNAISYVDGYNSVKDGYDNGLANNRPNSQPSDNAYISGYNQGNSIGQTARGAKDYLAGQQANNHPVNKDDYNQGYNDANAGYVNGMTGQQITNPNINTASPEYMNGKKLGSKSKDDYDQAEQESNPSADHSNYNSNKHGTYSGVADAINDVENAQGDKQKVAKPNGDPAYNLAYNQAVKDAQVHDGANDFVKGNAKQNVLTPANQSIYDKAYSDAQTGYDEALNGQSSQNNPNNQNEAIGFKAGQNTKNSYDAAIRAYDAASNKAAVSDQTNQPEIDADSYKNTIDALKAADNNQTNVNNHNPIYVFANSQELGRQKALNIINQSPRPNNPNNDGSQAANNSGAQNKVAFEKAYQNVIDGYNAGVTNNPDIKENGNDNLNKDSFNAGQAAGNQVRGANDYLSGKDTTKDNNNDYQIGVKNAQAGYNNGISNQTTPNVDINSPEYKNGQSNGFKDQSGYNVGINKALNTYNPTQNDSNAQILNHGSEQDSYNGAAAAIQAVKDADGNNNNIKPVNGRSPAYLKAYNDTLNKAEENAKSGQNNFLNGQVRNNNTDALSGVAADAYDHTQAGFQSALNGGIEPADNINEKAGFDQAKVIKRGYNQAVTDYNQGNNNPNAHSDMAGYQETMNGLIDGAKDNPIDNQPANNKSLYEAARAQSMGTKNGINDAVDNKDANENTSNGINDEIYQNAYQAAKAGYNNQKDVKPFDVIYNNAYEQGAQQKGANDYVAGKASDDLANENNLSSNDEYIRNHAQGIKDAEAAYNNQLNNRSNASITGKNAAINVNTGYKDAKNDQQPAANAPQAEKDAYWGAQVGANTGKQQSGDINPSSRAYQAAKARAEKDASNGAEQYLIDKFNNRNLEPSGNDSLYNQGYNNQKSYDAGFSNPNSQTPNYNNQGQINAYNAGKNDGTKTSSYNDALNGNKQDSDASYKGAQQGFADAQNGDALNLSNNMPAYNNPNDVLKYQSAYAKAYGEASNYMSQGARQYGSDANTDNPNVPSAKSNNGVTNQDTKSFNQGYNNQRAYEDGLNNSTDHSSSYANNSPEQKAYQAGHVDSQSVADASQDAADGVDRTQANQNAKDTYDGSKAGYADGVDGGQYTSNLDKNPAYQMAYNNSYNNMQRDRKAGTDGFFNQDANDFNNLNKINQAEPDVSHNANNMDNRAYNNGFAEQQGYAAGLINEIANNPYDNDADKGPTSRYVAYAKGLKDSKAGYEAAQDENNPDVTQIPANIVDEPSKEAYQAAAAAYHDVKNGSKPTDNTAKSDSYQMAYNMAYNTDQAAKTQGEDSFINPNPNNKDNKLSKAAAALYKQGNVDAQNGYNSIMNPSQKLIDGGSGNHSAEYQAGANLAKNILSGVQAAAKGDKNAPSADKNVVSGFNATNEAIKNAINDAKNSKNQINGRLNPSTIQIPSDILPTNQKVYIDVYQGAYDGYDNGLNGGNQNPNSNQDSNYNDLAYKAAYDSAFKQGQNDIPVPLSPTSKSDDLAAGIQAGQKAFISGIPLNINHINFAGKSQAYKDAFAKAYNQSQAGFKAGLNGAGDNSDDPSYQSGYNDAKAYQAGFNAAIKGKKLSSDSSYAYKLGYNAFKNGSTGKVINRKLVNSFDKAYRKAYERDYKAAHKEYLKVSVEGAKAGRKKAVGNNRVPRSLKHESPVYRAAYMEAFNEEVKRNLPSYVYNLKKIYSHDAPALTRKTRVNKYAKTPRYARHAFKVLGYKITSSGQVVYRVKGLGWINANDKSVDNLYYRRHNTKKPIHKVRVIKPEGTFIYDSKAFNKKTAIKKMKKGSVIKVERIEKVGGVTRFYIGDGKYISSNKTIVENVR